VHSKNKISCFSFELYRIRFAQRELRYLSLEVSTLIAELMLYTLRVVSFNAAGLPSSQITTLTEWRCNLRARALHRHRDEKARSASERP
jgi:hypothetical protein